MFTFGIRRIAFLFVFVIAAVSLDGLGAASQPAQAQPHRHAGQTRPPLPAVVLSHPLYQELYTFVADHIALYERMPCYCGCHRKGHPSLRACFLRKKRNTIEWSTHATDCGLCLTMAQDVQKLHAAGRSPREIERELKNNYSGF